MELRNCKLVQWNCETRTLWNYGTTKLTNLEIVKRRLKI